MKKPYNKVTKRLTKKDVLTVPNLLSLIRILMIPVIIWLYLTDRMIAAVCVLAASMATDLVDGRIARRYNMISDLGKFLDPLADKLMQAALMVCLISRYKWLAALFAFFVIKELSMLILGSVVLKRTDKLNSAKWYGKVATAVVDSTMLILFVFPSIPDKVAYSLAVLCGVLLAYAFVRYIMMFFSMLREGGTDTDGKDVSR